MRSVVPVSFVATLLLLGAHSVAGCSSSQSSGCYGAGCLGSSDASALDGSGNASDASLLGDAGSADDGGAAPANEGGAAVTDGATNDSGAGQIDASTTDAASGSGTFTCNSGLSCEVASQVCRHVNGGPIVADAAVNDSCVAIPASCASDVTCACLESSLDAQQCSETGGGFSVVVLVP